MNDLGGLVDDELADFVRARYPQLLRRGYLLTGSQLAAEDLVQEALARCCAAWRRHPVTEPDAYVQRVMVNVLISHSRLRRLREEATANVPEAADSDLTSQHADRDAVWRALQETAPRQRAVLVLRFYEGMTETEIAASLDITVGTVRSQTAKGLTRLRALVETTRTEDQR
ncbi:MAG TPA: SigE family RNA polymerase sigma factor [Acidothermaceae bacterium]|nr:SigE family RNA polymerase sigma factor [Acidothermaceae bacterium]